MSTKTKLITIEGRGFQISKFTPLVGIVIAKTFLAKVLPVFQGFLPMIKKAIAGDTESAEDLLANIDQFLNFDALSVALDKVSPSDLEYVMNRSLMCCHELLSAGPAQVLNPDGSYGVPDVEDDIVLALRLVCESVMWGLGDFFDAERCVSLLKPLSSSWPQNQQTTTLTSSLQ